MLGRDVRTLNKLFEAVVSEAVEFVELLLKLKEAVGVKQKKSIVGLKY